MRLILLDPPNTEPLSTDEVRDQLGLGSEITDATVDALIVAGRQKFDGPEGLLGRALITQLWQGDLDEFPCNNGNIDIPLPPLQEVISVSYVASDGSTVTMTVDVDYKVVQGIRPYISIVSGGSWPTASGVTITFLAGYGDDGDSVPAPIKQAMMLVISHLRSMSARNLFISTDTVDGVGSKQYVVGGNAGAAVDAAVAALTSPYRVLQV